MPRPLTELVAESLARTEADRWDLVAELMASLPDDPDAFGQDTPGYDAEILRRIEEVRNGTADMIPAAEAMRLIMSDDDDAG